jgi:hypothetical protein
MKSIPQRLSKEIGLYNSKKKTEALAERLEAQKELKDKKEFWANEKKLYSQKATLYERIIKWKNEFKSSKEFKRLFKNESDIIILDDGWGHEKPRYEPCDGCWSRIYLDRHGNLKYSAGYKWMPTGPSFFIDCKSVSKLTHDYVQSLYKHLDSGEVYKTILERVKELNKDI